MTLEQKITEDLKHAMKAKDEMTTSCLRMAKAALKNLRVEKGRDLSEDEVQGVLVSLIKKGREAAGEFRAGGRTDLAAKEEREVEIYYGYLPRQLSAAEVEAVVREVISELSAKGPGDLGKVMKAAMPKMAGRAQGKEVNDIAKRLLQRS